MQSQKKTFYFYRLYELDSNNKRKYHIQAIENYLDNMINSRNIKLTKINQSIFAGITIINKTNNFYAFNIEKADRTKKAIIVDTKKNISDGREEYGGVSDKGAARDTIVGYNAHNGLLILTGRPAMGIEMLKKFLKKSITNLKDIRIEYIIDESRNIESIANLDSISRIEFRVSRIKNGDKSETMRDFVSLGNHKLECKLYGGGIVVSNIKQMFKNLKKYIKGTDSEISKFKVIGADDGDTQIIDLISHRVTGEGEVDLVDGKVTVGAMLEAITQVYKDNIKRFEYMGFSKLAGDDEGETNKGS